MSLPFFDLLNATWPSSQVDIIAKQSVRDIFVSLPNVRRIHSFRPDEARRAGGIYNYGRTLRQHGPYDMFITLAPSFSSALMGFAVGIPVRLGYRGDGRSLLLTHRFSREKGAHRVSAYCRLLRAFLENTARAEQSYGSISPLRWHFLDNEEEFFFTNDPRPTHIVFNVNSEASSRRLPVKTWRTLGSALLRDRSALRRLVFIGTQAEQARVRQVIEGIQAQPGEIMDYSGKTSLRDLARLLRDAALVVSNDSGPMHLANAVGTPLVTFFGAGDADVTGPVNRENTVILNKRLKCSPCVKNVCRFSTLRCLEQISAEDIYQSLAPFLPAT